MVRAARENAMCALLATAASAAIAWLGLYGFGWNDYEVEVEPSLRALVDGHVSEFLRLAPAYGGSLIERAPFALLPGLWGGGALAIYQTIAVPCLVAAAALGVWLCARMRAQQRPTLARGIALALCVANPITLEALEAGHPEEILGAALCVAAVLLGARGRSVWCGVALGLAIANKQWAVLALGPALLAIPAVPKRRRWHGQAVCLCATGAVAAVVLAPLVLVHMGTFIENTRATTTTSSAIFQPWQVWWFFGYHGPLVHGLFGAAKPGYRTGPPWAGLISHPLVLASGVVLTVVLWWRVRRQRLAALTQRDALLALSLLLLARCVLDTWDTVYYMLPFIFALLAWEVETGPGERARQLRPGVGELPVLALLATMLTWIGFVWLPEHGAAPDVWATFFLAWTLPLTGALTLVLWRPALLSRRGVGAGWPWIDTPSTASVAGTGGLRHG